MRERLNKGAEEMGITPKLLTWRTDTLTKTRGPGFSKCFVPVIAEVPWGTLSKLITDLSNGTHPAKQVSQQHVIASVSGLRKK